MNCTNSQLPIELSKLKETICRIATDESGIMLETAVQSLSSQEFFSIFERIDGQDREAVSIVDDLIMFVAQRTATPVDYKNYVTAVGNVFMLFYCESLRRKGILTYHEQRNYFESNDNCCRLESLPETIH